MSKLVPASWLDGHPKRIVVHWTAGGSVPSAHDLQFYHLLIDSLGKLHRGDHAISDNDKTGDDDYAAHTRGCNTRAIGVSLCGMAGAVQHPFKPGPFPLTRAQWNTALIAIADLCHHYGIAPTPEDLLMHCEVEEFLGIQQRGKWDVACRTWEAGEKWQTLTPGLEMRARVALLLKE